MSSRGARAAASPERQLLVSAPAVISGSWDGAHIGSMVSGERTVSPSDPPPTRLRAFSSNIFTNTNKDDVLTRSRTWGTSSLHAFVHDRWRLTPDRAADFPVKPRPTLPSSSVHGGEAAAVPPAQSAPDRPPRRERGSPSTIQGCARGQPGTTRPGRRPSPQAAGGPETPRACGTMRRLIEKLSLGALVKGTRDA